MALSERESLALVSAAGIPVTEVTVVTDAPTAVAAARRIGRPVALKLDAVGLAHKSEVGGLALGLRGDDAVYGAALTLLETGRRHNLTVRGLLVEPMAAPGVELILGLRRDPQFGPAVLVGLGGVLTEVLDDVAIRLAPLDVQGSEPDGDVVEDLGQDAAEPDQHGRPNCGSRRRPRMSSTPGAAIGSTSRPRTVRSCRRPVSSSVRGGAVDRVVAAQPERQPADLALVGEPDGIELERDRPPDPARRGDRVGGVGHDRDSVTGIPAADTRARLSRSDSATGGRAGRRVG